jgi:hypothetical protein
MKLGRNILSLLPCFSNIEDLKIYEELTGIEISILLNSAPNLKSLVLTGTSREKVVKVPTINIQLLQLRSLQTCTATPLSKILPTIILPVAPNIQHLSISDTSITPFVCKLLRSLHLKWFYIDTLLGDVALDLLEALLYGSGTTLETLIILYSSTLPHSISGRFSNLQNLSVSNDLLRLFIKDSILSSKLKGLSILSDDAYIIRECATIDYEKMSLTIDSLDELYVLDKLNLQALSITSGKIGYVLDSPLPSFRCSIICLGDRNVDYKLQNRDLYGIESLLHCIQDRIDAIEIRNVYTTNISYSMLYSDRIHVKRMNMQYKCINHLLFGFTFFVAKCTGLENINIFDTQTRDYEQFTYIDRVQSVVRLTFWNVSLPVKLWVNILILFPNITTCEFMNCKKIDAKYSEE